MSSLADLSPPTSIDPYEVLGISSTSSAAEIRTAYRRLALRVHPDKVPPEDRDAANKSFQELAFAYAVLSDEARRKRYDDTGSTSEGIDGDGFDWFSFWKEQVKDLINPESMEKFRVEYQGSDEERRAVLEAYVDGKGSMDVIFERVMVSNVLDDEERFAGIIMEAIAAGEVVAFKKFTNESKASKNRRRKQAEGEKMEAEGYAKELGVYDQLFGAKKEVREKQEGKKGKRGARAADRKEEADTSGLENLIKNRSMNKMGDFMANLEAKYGAGGSETRKASGGRKRMDEPTDEEFEAARKRMEASSGQKSKDDAGAGRRSKRLKR